MSKNIYERHEATVQNVPRDNPHVDMRQVAEWIKLAKFMDSLPDEERVEPEPVKLQPIPLRAFGQ